MITFKRININCRMPFNILFIFEFPQLFPPEMSHSWAFCFPNLCSSQDLYIAFGDSLVLNLQQFPCLKKNDFPPKNLEQSSTFWISLLVSLLLDLG